MRFGTHPIAWERHTGLEETLRLEFSTGDGSPDLHLSVFELERTDVVAALAQLAASHFNPPPSSYAINVADANRPVVPTPGDTAFALTQNRHRELQIRDRQDLQVLVRSWRESLAGRSVLVTRQQLYDHVIEQVRGGDLEWRHLLDSGKAKPWVPKQARKA